MTLTLSALQKQRRDTAANWTAENPTLLAGEILARSRLATAAQHGQALAIKGSSHHRVHIL